MPVLHAVMAQGCTEQGEKWTRANLKGENWMSKKAWPIFPPANFSLRGWTSGRAGACAVGAQSTQMLSTSQTLLVHCAYVSPGQFFPGTKLLGPSPSPRAKSPPSPVYVACKHLTGQQSTHPCHCNKLVSLPGCHHCTLLDPVLEVFAIWSKFHSYSPPGSVLLYNL